MREIRFRGLNYVAGEYKWVYGDLIRYQRTRTQYIQEEGSSTLRLVNPESIGQYTGLLDENRARIFEGDIVKATGTYPGEGWFDTGEHDYNFTGLVKWDTDMATYILGGYRLCTLDKLVVLGNIHDNPELLEVE